jgi:hypothetical protein
MYTKDGLDHVLNGGRGEGDEEVVHTSSELVARLDLDWVRSTMGEAKHVPD